MRRIADQQQSWPVPAFQAAGIDGQQFDLIPVGQVWHTVGQSGSQPEELCTQLFDSGCLLLRKAALDDDLTYLPVVRPL